MPTTIQSSDINRYAIARAIGSVDQSHIGRIFNPKHTGVWPSLALAKKISEQLGSSIDDLYAYLESIGKVNPRE
jgi:DNA-binding XRE family transcriptional regulator